MDNVLIVARLRGHGAELLEGIAPYEDRYRLCCLCGAEGIIVGLAEPLGRSGPGGADPASSPGQVRAALRQVPVKDHVAGKGRHFVVAQHSK